MNIAEEKDDTGCDTPPPPKMRGKEKSTYVREMKRKVKREKYESAALDWSNGKFASVR